MAISLRKRFSAVELGKHQNRHQPEKDINNFFLLLAKVWRVFLSSYDANEHHLMFNW